MAAQVLGRRVDHDVGAEGERALQVGGGEGVVDHDQGAPAVGELGHRGDIGDGEQRIGGALDPHHAGLGPPRPGQGGQVPHLDGIEGEPGRAMDLGGQAIGPPVGVVGQQQMVAGTQEAQDGVAPGEAAGEGHPVGATLQGGDAVLEGGPGRVAAAAVLVAPVLTDRGLGEGGGLVDRRDDRAGGRIGVLAGVDGPGLEAPRLAHGATMSVGRWTRNSRRSDRVRMPTG